MYRRGDPAKVCELSKALAKDSVDVNVASEGFLTLV
jgi:hypothetical protein